MSFNKEQIKNFSSKCGVYIMKDINERVLYVGKASNLRNRIKQYFFFKDTRAAIPFLVKQIENIETIIVSTPKEALILENTLIKKFQPKYNILLKDDKTYISIMINISHKWPMLKLIRIKSQPKDKNLYFGPYTNTKAAKSIKDLLLKIFPLRQCSDKELTNRTKPCILYDIKKCLAPCTDKCTKKQYDLMLDKIVMFLKGRDKTIIKDLQNKMKIASQALEYEKANSYLKLIKQIKHITQMQYVDTLKAKNLDVIGFYKSDFHIIIVKLIFQNGRLTQSEHFSFSEIAASLEEVIETFIYQHYINKEINKLEILTPIKLKNSSYIQEINKKIKITCPQKGKKKELVHLAKENAKNIFSREKDLKDLKEKQLLELSAILNLTNFPNHIACFDISNISQTYAVGAMVTFIDGRQDKNQTRLFKIKTIQKGDIPSLKEILYRHFSKTNKFPDLVILDGNKAHLNAAHSILKQLKIASIDLIAITKEMAKHTKSLTQEKIFTLFHKDPIFINAKSPILFFLQNIRDSAHQTAIAFHKKTRSKKIITTKLLQIPKIGPKKTQKLLKHFKSMENIKKTDKQDLKNLKILTDKEIDALFEYLKNFS